MNIPSSLKKRFGNIYLKNSLKHLKRKKQFFNFKTAKTAGIIFSAKHQAHFLQAKQFAQFLREEQDISTYALGYVDNKDAIAYFPYKKGVDFFSVKNVNWYNRPLNSVVDEFINKEFDILFDFSSDQEFSLMMVFSQSKAIMKITQNPKYEIYSDLYLNTGKLDPLTLQTQVKHYLSSIETI